MRKILKRCIIACFVLLFLYSSSLFAFTSAENSGGAVKKSGPMAIRNQMPLYLFFLQMAPDKPETVRRDKWTINAEYTVSNITVSAFTPATSLYDIQIDMEVSRIGIDMRYGLCDNLEIGMEIPYLSLSGGYLDDFIEGIEDGIGARTPRSRERQGSYEFDYTFRYNNQFLIQQKSSTDGLGDIVLNFKYQFLNENRYLPAVSLRSAIKFPTASKDDLLGSGEYDYGFGLLAGKGLFDKLFLYAGANVIRIEKPGFFEILGIDEEYYTGLVAAEFLFTKRFSVVTQVTGNNTPYPHSDTNPLDNNAYELGIGFNYAFKEKTEGSWYFGIAENISAASSPDVSFHTGLRWRF